MAIPHKSVYSFREKPVFYKVGLNGITRSNGHYRPTHSFEAKILKIKQNI